MSESGRCLILCVEDVPDLNREAETITPRRLRQRDVAQEVGLRRPPLDCTPIVVVGEAHGRPDTVGKLCRPPGPELMVRGIAQRLSGDILGNLIDVAGIPRESVDRSGVDAQLETPGIHVLHVLEPL